MPDTTRGWHIYPRTLQPASFKPRRHVSTASSCRSEYPRLVTGWSTQWSLKRWPLVPLRPVTTSIDRWLLTMARWEEAPRAAAEKNRQRRCCQSEASHVERPKADYSLFEVPAFPLIYSPKSRTHFIHYAALGATLREKINLDFTFTLATVII